MRYLFIEMYDGEQPHVESVYDTNVDNLHDPEYIEHILGQWMSCVWNCEDGEGKALTQVFVKID